MIPESAKEASAEELQRYIDKCRELSDAGDGEVYTWWCRLADILASRPPRQDDEIRKAALEEATASAQLARLHTLLMRIRWYDLGIPAIDEADTAQALIEVTQYLLTDALDEALSRALSQKGDEADG